MQYRPALATIFKVLFFISICLIEACATRPENKIDNQDNAFFQNYTQTDYYFEHISDDPDEAALQINDAQKVQKSQIKPPKRSPLDTQQKNNTAKALPPPKFSLKQRMPRANMGGQLPSWVKSKNYSFRANNLDVRQALKMFSKVYGLNIYYEPEVRGKITVEFNRLPLKKAMEVILSSHKYYWQWQENLIYVGKYQTKDFVIDYIRLTRTGSGSSKTSTVTKGQGGASASITQNDTISFWDDLEGQLKSLLSDTGKLTINKTTGNIQVTDTTDHIKQIERYINNIKSTLTRQVIIEARIVEVQLSNDNRLGVDWEKFNFLNFTAVSNTIAGISSRGLSLKTATANITYNDGRFKAMISALSEQGNTKVMSQPRIRTLNNQPAIIKAGTDRTFFTTTATTTTNNGTTQVVTSEKPTTVTEGIVLSITPQISLDGKIILDVSPVITRISDVTTSQFGSTAPVLDVKQTSALIQTIDGEMVVLGGMIQDVKIKNKRSIPLLGSIPFIGALFRSESTSIQRTELVIFLVAKII